MSDLSEKKLIVCDLGRQPAYREVWAYQQQLQKQRIAREIEDTLLLVEHAPVYTVGKNGSDDHVIASASFLESLGAEVVQVDRGGDVTYHGPGQLVGYPIFDLHQHRQSISWYMRQLENLFIDLLAGYGIAAGRDEDFTGVWIGNDKILALGVRISRWVTMHGFAFNISTDLGHFDGIIPCGIFHKGVTSLEKLLNRPVGRGEVLEKLIPLVAERFGFDAVERQPHNGRLAVGAKVAH